MKTGKTKQDLVEELQAARQRVAHLEKVETELRKTQQALHETETRFQLFLDNSPSVAFIKDLEGRHLYVNETFHRVFQLAPSDVLGKTAFELFSTEIAEKLQAHDALVLAGEQALELTEEVPGPDGVLRSWLVFKFPFADASGQRFVGGVAIDVTERKRAEDRLQTLSRLLLEAQESERRNLARELHDEIGQSLTALKLTLEMSMRSEPDARPHHLAKAQSLTLDLIERTRGLSLRLRPTMLDDLGLLPALRWYCVRYTDNTGVQVNLQHTSLEQRRFTSDVETAAYRIVQEGLTNVARHAGVQEVSVNLWADANVLVIDIEDRGRGFDPEKALAAGSSCGLGGMRERAALLGGDLHIESVPGMGTFLHARLPCIQANDQP